LAHGSGLNLVGYLSVSVFRDVSMTHGWHTYIPLESVKFINLQANVELQSVISPDIDAGLRFSLPESCTFFGREAELAKLETKVGFGANIVPQRSIVTVWGLAGIGKSQLVAEFVKRQRRKYPDADIFWVSGATKEAFEQSIMDILKVGSGPEIVKPDGTVDSDEQRSKLIDSLFLELKNGMRTKWLLVIDGISGDKPTQQHIQGYLNTLQWGYIILTTGSSDVASWYNGSMKIKGLSERDAVKFLAYETDNAMRSEDEGMTISPFCSTTEVALSRSLPNKQTYLNLQKC
jgi:hypothetical protein